MIGEGKEMLLVVREFFLRQLQIIITTLLLSFDNSSSVVEKVKEQ